MLYINGRYLVAYNGEISDEIKAAIARMPTDAPKGYGYKLVAETLEWELVEFFEDDETTETTAYTEEELTAMTNAELQAICEELGISSSMTKANMVELILSKQNA